ncbi:hypothetical protein BGW41_000806 [Actinomortierella wolfii]|nr:hypothetical protein BGW41_000806 [Actinomortierella wolfii]
MLLRNMGGGVDVMGVQGNEVLQQEQQQSNPDHNFHCMDLLALHSVTRQQQEDKQAAEAAEAAAAALVAASAAAVAAANASVFTHVGNTTEAQHTNITNQHTTPTTNSYTNTLFHPTRPFTMQQFRPWQFSAFPIKHPFVFHPPNEDSSSTAMTAKQKAVYPTMICPRKRSFEEAIEMAQPLREEEPSTLEHPGWLGAIKRRKIHHSATLWTSSLSPSPYVKLLAIRGFWDVMRSRVDLSWMESKFTARREFDDDEEEDGDESNEGAESDIYSDSQDHSDAFSSPSSGAEDSDEGTDSCEDEVDNALDRDWMNTPQNRWNKEKRTVDAKESKRRLGKMRESALSAGTNMTSATPNMTSVPRAIQRRKSHRRQRSRQAPATRDDGATTNHWDFRTSILSTSACNTCIRRVVLKHPNTVLLFRGLWAEEERNRRQRQQIPEGVHKPSRSKIINSRPLSRVHGPIHLSRTYGSTNEQQSNAHHQQQYSRRRTRNASVALDHTSEDSDDDEDDEVNDDDANSDDGTTPTTMREEQARQQHRQQQQDYEMELRRKHGLKTPLRRYDLSDYKPWKDGTISPQRGCIQTLDRLRTHLLEPWPKEEAKAKDECTRILHRMREQLNVVINLQIHLRSMMKSAPNQLSFLLSIRHPGQVSIELLQALYGPQFMDSSAFRTIEQLLWGSDGYHRRAGTSSAEASQPHAEEEDHALTSQQQQEQQEQHFHNHHHQQHINHHQQLEYHHPYEEYDQSGRDREACDTKQVEEDEEDENMSDDLSTEIHSSMEATVDSLGIH